MFTLFPAVSLDSPKHWLEIETVLGNSRILFSAQGIHALHFVDALDEAGSAALPMPKPSMPSEWIRTIQAVARGEVINSEIPLDPGGTAFQRRVWTEIAAIPPGLTVHYEQIARAIGIPKAVRAVGVACGRNPIALLIPCHRVVRKDGSLGGYAWGIERKQRLLQQEMRTAGLSGIIDRCC
jgi:AraC family transcriptional regulator of adaptative response/methylated-DNA-[protein]-cysteine methyltransferase